MTNDERADAASGAARGGLWSSSFVIRIWSFRQGLVAPLQLPGGVERRQLLQPGQGLGRGPPRPDGVAPAGLAVVVQQMGLGLPPQHPGRGGPDPLVLADV